MLNLQIVKKVVIIAMATAFVLAVGVFIFAAYEVANFSAGRAAYQRGYDAMTSHNYDSAIRDFTASLKKPSGQSKRAWTLAYRGESYRGLRRFADAIDDFSAALKLYPDFTYALEARGFAYEETRQSDLALADYQQALCQDPNLALVWYYAGLIYERAHDFEPARDAFRQAIRAYPKYVDAYIEAGYASSHLKDRDGAIASFDSAIRINPRSAAAFAARGRLYRSEHEDDRAIADLTMAIHLAPKQKSYSYARALTYLELKSYAKAIADFTQVLQLDPRDERTWRQRALAYRTLKNYPQAIADFTELIKLTQSANAYNNRAHTYFMAGQYQAALDDYEQANGLGRGAFPTRPRSLAWFLATCPDPAFRDGAKAVEQATQECEQSSWHNWSKVDTLAAAEAEVGKYDDAARYEQQAIDLASKNPQVQSHLKDRLALYRDRKPFRDEPDR